MIRRGGRVLRGEAQFTGSGGFGDAALIPLFGTIFGKAEHATDLEVSSDPESTMTTIKEAILTDPLTYFTGGLSAAAKAAKYTRQGLKAAKAIKSLPAPALGAFRAPSSAAGFTARRAWTKEAAKVMPERVGNVGTMKVDEVRQVLKHSLATNKTVTGEALSGYGNKAGGIFTSDRSTMKKALKALSKKNGDEVLDEFIHKSGERAFYFSFLLGLSTEKGLVRIPKFLQGTAALLGQPVRTTSKIYKKGLATLPHVWGLAGKALPEEGLMMGAYNHLTDFLEIIPAGVTGLAGHDEKAQAYLKATSSELVSNLGPEKLLPLLRAGVRAASVTGRNGVLGHIAKDTKLGLSREGIQHFSPVGARINDNPIWKDISKLESGDGKRWLDKTAQAKRGKTIDKAKRARMWEEILSGERNWSKDVGKNLTKTPGEMREALALELRDANAAADLDLKALANDLGLIGEAEFALRRAQNAKGAPLNQDETLKLFSQGRQEVFTPILGVEMAHLSDEYKNIPKGFGLAARAKQFGQDLRKHFAGKFVGGGGVKEFSKIISSTRALRNLYQVRLAFYAKQINRSYDQIAKETGTTVEEVSAAFSLASSITPHTNEIRALGRFIEDMEKSKGKVNMEETLDWVHHIDDFVSARLIGTVKDLKKLHGGGETKGYIEALVQKLSDVGFDPGRGWTQPLVSADRSLAIPLASRTKIQGSLYDDMLASVDHLKNLTVKAATKGETVSKPEIAQAMREIEGHLNALQDFMMEPLMIGAKASDAHLGLAKVMGNMAEEHASMASKFDVLWGTARPIGYVPRVLSSVHARRLNDIVSEISGRAPGDSRSVIGRITAAVNRKNGHLTVPQLNLLVEKLRRENVHVDDLNKLIDDVIDHQPETGAKYNTDNFIAFITSLSTLHEYDNLAGIINSVEASGVATRINGTGAPISMGRVLAVFDNSKSIDVGEVRAKIVREGEEATPAQQKMLNDAEEARVLLEETGSSVSEPIIFYAIKTGDGEKLVSWSAGGAAEAGVHIQALGIGRNAGEATARASALADKPFANYGKSVSPDEVSRALMNADSLGPGNGLYVAVGGEGVLNSLDEILRHDSTSMNFGTAMWDQTTKLLKMGLTTMDADFHVRNFASVVPLLHFDGVSFGNILMGLWDSLMLMGKQIPEMGESYGHMNKFFNQGGFKLPFVEKVYRLFDESTRLTDRGVIEALDEIERLDVDSVLDKVFFNRKGEQLTFREWVEPLVSSGLIKTQSSVELSGKFEAATTRATVLKEHDPLSRLSVKRIMHATNTAGEFSELLSRLWAYNAYQRQGLDRWAAATQAKTVLVDYDDLTSFEKNVMRRNVPFYTWSRKTLPRFVNQSAENPSAFGKTMHSFFGLREGAYATESSDLERGAVGFMLGGPLGGLTGMLWDDAAAHNFSRVPSGIRTETEYGSPGVWIDRIRMNASQIVPQADLLSAVTWGAEIFQAPTDRVLPLATEGAYSGPGEMPGFMQPHFVYQWAADAVMGKGGSSSDTVSPISGVGHDFLDTAAFFRQAREWSKDPWQASPAHRSYYDRWKDDSFTIFGDLFGGKDRAIVQQSLYAESQMREVYRMYSRNLSNPEFSAEDREELQSHLDSIKTRYANAVSVRQGAYERMITRE